MNPDYGSMVLMEVVRERGWWFAPNGELRECIVVKGSHDLFLVIDAGTGFPIDVRRENVLTEAPKE